MRNGAPSVEHQVLPEGMQAALFTMRCFETEETEFPFFCASFIVYGAAESLPSKAERLFAEHLAMCERPCGRVHKTGPLQLNPFLISESERKQVDWLGVAERVESEKPQRLQDQGRCTFREIHKVTTVRIEQAGQTATVEFDAEEEGNLLDKDREPMPPAEPEVPRGSKFLFIGSRYENNAAQRVGEVFVVEVPALDEAADICMGALGLSQTECMLVQWCCPVHSGGF